MNIVFCRLTIRADEGRVDEEDLIIAGLKTPLEIVESTSSSLSIKCDPDNDSTVKDVSSCFEDMNTNTKMSSNYLTAKSNSNEDVPLDLNDDYKSCQITEHHAYESDDTDSTLSQPSSRTTDDFEDDEIENTSDSKSDEKIKEKV